MFKQIESEFRDGIKLFSGYDDAANTPLPVSLLTPYTVERLVCTEQSVVVAGHYCLADHMQDLSSDGDAEQQSFRVGAAMVREAIRSENNSELVLWINDIGITPAERDAFRQQGMLPASYRDILEEEDLDEVHLTVILESAMRNKASTRLRKLYKRDPELFDKVDPSDPALIRCVSRSACDIRSDGELSGHAYIVDGPNGEKLVVKEGSNPKCNLILATFFEELRQRFSPKHIFALFNDVYAYRLGLGTHVAQAVLGNPVPISVLLCDGDRIYAGPNDCIHEDFRSET